MADERNENEQCVEHSTKYNVRMQKSFIEIHPEYKTLSLWNLFDVLNVEYFNGMLKHIRLLWSKKLGTRAGTCSRRSRVRSYLKTKPTTIRVNETMIRPRQRKDWIEVLLVSSTILNTIYRNISIFVIFILSTK